MRLFKLLGGCGAAGVLLAVLALPSAGRAEGTQSPLVEMRAAAEALADVDPDIVRSRPDGKIPGTGKTAKGDAARAREQSAAAAREQDPRGASRASARAALHAEVRSAINDEISRELQGQARAVRNVPPGKAVAAEAPGKDKDSERANEAAKQAQQARLNRAVGQSRAPGRVGKPLLTATPDPGRSLGR